MSLPNDSLKQPSPNKEVPTITVGGTGEMLVIVCAGGCGKTTEDVNFIDFWKGEVKQSNDPEERVPVWTCKECVEKRQG